MERAVFGVLFSPERRSDHFSGILILQIYCTTFPRKMQPYFGIFPKVALPFFLPSVFIYGLLKNFSFSVDFYWYLWYDLIV